MTSTAIQLRNGTAADLTDINAVIDAAVMTWDLPERVKRLALPSYRYQPHDLVFLELIVATNADGVIVGVAGYEQADPADSLSGRHTLLLHGLYISPAQQRRGIGRQLFRAVEDAARQRGFDNLLVKAQTAAEAFFIAQGLEKLPIQDSGRDYANRYWKML